MVDEENILTFVVVNSGIGSKVLDEAKKIGASGGTIFLGKGTVKNHILEFLGLDRVKKEIVLIVSEKQLENQIHETLTKKCHIDKPNHGIVFSTSLNKVIGLEISKESINEPKTGGNYEMDEYEAIFTIVERGLGQEVIDVANSAGSRGATIINARGSGIHEEETFFAMRIEPEKEIVMIIIEKEKSDKVIKSIKDALHIDEKGKGIMFVMDVNKTSGLFKEDD
ncbi:MAG TPA: P-II family nitrogen regulator [Tissierellales bacterium]|nr:P-II family nitrogen regulator [Tissierellales bacterium]